MGKTLDLFEYANDAAAQAAYVSSDGYGTDVLTGGTPSADTEYGAGYEATKACDNDTATEWISTVDGFPHWWKYDLGAAVTKIVQKVRIKPGHGVDDYQRLKNFKVQGSNNNTDWTDLYTGQHADNIDWEDYTFSNFTAYRYYRIYIIDIWGTLQYAAIYETEMMEVHTQCYSEATIKTQGSYSLKGYALITNSLNDTLTRTVSPVLNLSNIDALKLDIQASRTGSNIKVGIHDSGGVTTELTPNVATADTNQQETWDVSAVTNANKDAIDSIIITILNADASNTFYLDNFYGEIDKIFNETITTSEVFGRGIAKNPSETITLSETFARAMTLQRWLETVTLTEVAQKEISFFITETLTLSDSISKAMTRELNDTLTLSEVYNRMWAIRRAYSEIITLSEPAFSKQITKLFNDLTTLVENYQRWLQKGHSGITWNPDTSATDIWSTPSIADPDWSL